MSLTAVGGTLSAAGGTLAGLSGALGDVDAYIAAVLASSPQVMYTMNEGTGTTLEDLVSARDATLGPASWSSPGPLNQTNALAFNGTSSYARAADAAAWDTFSPTFSAWIKTTVGGTILARDDSPAAWTARSFKATVSPNTISFRRYSSFATVYSLSTGAADPCDGEWHHIAWRYVDNTYYQAAMDGVDLGWVVVSTGCNYSSEPLVIGAIRNGAGYTSFFPGEIALLAYWNNWPDISTLISHYEAGLP